MSVPQGVNISGPVVPTDTTDIFPTHLDIWGKGGWVSVDDHTARDAITAERRSEGMIAYTKNDGFKWQLQPDMTSWALLEAASYACKTVVLGTITEGTDVLSALFTTPGIGSCVLNDIKINCREVDQPTGQDLVIDILVDGVSIWASHPENRLTLPDAQNSAYTNTFTNDTFTNGIVTFNIIQAAGSNVTVEMEFSI